MKSNSNAPTDDKKSAASFLATLRER